MADVNANIGVNIDTSAALAELKNLQRSLAQFHSSVNRSSATAAAAQRNLQQNLMNSVNATGTWTAQMKTIRTSTESFTNALEKNKLSMTEYFRFGVGASKTFSRVFANEFDTVNKVARERVKDLQTQYIKLGRDASGAMKAIAIRPAVLDLEDYTTRQMIAAQRQQIFNQLLRQGTTNLLNFGKNTQWAGRQLMVGFTIPLSIFGATASRVFMDLETQAIKFRKVYGDLFTLPQETEFTLNTIRELANEFTKYGVAVTQTMSLAAEASAAGFTGTALTGQIEQATKLSVLGQVEQQKALETTIALQSAFRMSTEQLADSINFLNAVENQTVVALDDVSTAIPKVAPVIMQLGGNVKDLAFFLAAMKEGGVNASEGANALKSGLASLINPTDKAADMLKTMGIDIIGIVEKNQGNLKQTVIEFAQALDTLDPLTRARAIEQLFGKFQFARLSTLFSNVTRDGTQASRVLDLAGLSTEQLARISSRELALVEESITNKFLGAVERLRVAIAPIGEDFLRAVTPIVEFITKIANKFSELPENVKSAVTIITALVGGIGPILLMTFGLLANGVANIAKGLLVLRNGYLRLTGQNNALGMSTEYLTQEQLQAQVVAASLNQVHSSLTQQFTVEKSAVDQLAAAYRSAATASTQFAGSFPGAMRPRMKLANGIVSVPGTGNKDTVPAMLTPGEAVIPKEMAKKYAPLINAMVAGNVPGYQRGKQVSNASGFVFTHGIAPVNLAQEIVDRLAALTKSQIQRRSFTEATSVKGLTNFGFVAPEALNMGKMTGQESSAFFRQNAELATSRLMQSVSQLIPGAAQDPAIKADMRQFAYNIADELSKSGTAAVSEPQFYASVENALQKTFTRATSTAFEPAMKNIQRQVTTAAAFGGAANRGSRGQRIALSRTLQQAALGAEQPITSYKSGRLSTILKKFGFQSATSVSEGAKTKSPSKISTETGQDIGDGLIVGMQSKQDDVVRTGTDLGRQAVTAVDTGVTQTQGRRGRRVASRAQGPAEQRLTYNPLAAAPAGATMLPLVSRPATEFAEELDRNKRGLRKYYGKLNAGMLALSGLTTAMSFMGGGVGQAAQQVLGLVFALQGVSALLPLLANPWGLAIAGIAGLALLFYKFKKDQEQQQKDLYDATQKLIEAQSSSAQATEEYAKFIGEDLLPSAKEFTRINPKLVDATEEMVKVFEDYYKEETKTATGTKTTRGAFIREALSRGGRGAAATAIAQDVARRAAIFGLSPEEIAANVRAAAESVGDAQLAVQVTAQLRGMFGPDGTNILEKPLTVQSRIEFLRKDIQKATRDLANMQIKSAKDAQDAINKEVETISVGGGTYEVPQTPSTYVPAEIKQSNLTIQETAKVTEIASRAIDSLRQGMSLLNNEFANGEMTQKEYNRQFNIFIQQSKNLQTSIQRALPDFTAMSQTSKELFTAELLAPAMLEFKLKNPEQFNQIVASIASISDSEIVADIAIETSLGGLAPWEVVDLADRLNQIDLSDPTALINIDVQGMSALQQAIMRIIILREQLRNLQAKTATGPDTVIRQLGLEKELSSAEADANRIRKVIQQTEDLLGGNGPGTGGGGGGGDRQTIFDDLLRRLRDVRDASIDAQGGIKEIIRLIASGIGTFNGFETQLLKAGANKEFISFLSGLDKKTLATFVNISKLEKGIVSFTARGRGLKQLYDEKVIGDYNNAQVESIRNAQAQQRAFTKLRAAGVSAATAYEMIADEQLAVAINSKSTTGKELRIMARNAREAKAALKEVNDQLQLSSFLSDKLDEFELFSQMPALTARLREMGFSIQQIDAVLNNPVLAKGILRDLTKGRNLSKDILRFLESIPKSASFQLEIDLQTPQGRLDFFQQVYSQAQQYFDALVDLERIQIQSTPEYQALTDQIEAQTAAVADAEAQISALESQISSAQFTLEYDPTFGQVVIDGIRSQIDTINREIETQFARPIEAIQKTIEASQREIELRFDRPIAALQEESSDLSNALELIDREAAKINSKYDAQIDALNEVASINQDIANQQRAQLDVASALSSGDIAAAARAMQEARKQQAEQATQRKIQAVEDARQVEIDRLRAVNGMTRVQIEERQFEINQQIFALEEQRDIIQALNLERQDAIYELQQQQAVKQEEIRQLEEKIYAIELLREPLIRSIKNLEMQISQLTKDRLEPANALLKSATDARDQMDKQAEAILKTATFMGYTKEELDKMLPNLILAATNAGQMSTAMQNALKALMEIAGKWEGIQDKTVKLTILQETITVSGPGGTVTGTPTDVTQFTGPLPPGRGATPMTPDGIKRTYYLGSGANRVFVTEYYGNQPNDVIPAPEGGGTAGQTPAPQPTPAAKTEVSRSYRGSGMNRVLVITYSDGSVSEIPDPELPSPRFGGPLVPTALAAGGKVKYYPMGGLVPYMANGGMFTSINTDNVPAMLTAGEFVVRRAAVRDFGVNNLEKINSGTYSSGSVYNYNLNVNVRSDADPNQIARTVMTQIRNVDSQRIRGQR